jgi:hypothetical protein
MKRYSGAPDSAATFELLVGLVLAGTMSVTVGVTGIMGVWLYRVVVVREAVITPTSQDLTAGRELLQGIRLFT